MSIEKALTSLRFNGTFRVDVVYNTSLVNPKELNSYWDLINPKWKGKVAGLSRR